MNEHKSLPGRVKNDILKRLERGQTDSQICRELGIARSSVYKYKRATLPFKRVVVVSDLHCGHGVGLTPTAWQWRDDEDDLPEHKRKKARIQKSAWSWFEREIIKLKPIYGLIANGDLIDGKGERSGGNEQIITDLDEQAQMAVKCLLTASADKVAIIAGTPYHVGTAEQYERIASRMANAKFASHEWISVNGVVFDCKHKVGSSSIPHGRMTALAKDKLWNDLWSMRDLQPSANVLLRSHVHYHHYIGGPNWMAATTPALQGFGSRYGKEQCSGLVDFGFLVFDCYQDGTFTWQSRIKNDFEEHKAEVTEW